MRTDDLYLVDLIESADALQAILRERDFAAFIADDTVRSAALWKLYVVAEACSRLSTGSRDRFLDVPWEQIRAFRNRMAHGYFTLAWDRIWSIITQSVPHLLSQAEVILSSDFPDVFKQLQERRSGSPDESHP